MASCRKFISGVFQQDSLRDLTLLGGEMFAAGCGLCPFCGIKKRCLWTKGLEMLHNYNGSTKEPTKNQLTCLCLLFAVLKSKGLN